LKGGGVRISASYVMQRPSTVPRLNISTCKKNTRRKAPAPVDIGSTFTQSSRFKPQKRHPHVLSGPQKPTRRPKTAPETIQEYYKRQKQELPWKSKRKYIQGFSGHIHGMQHIDGVVQAKATEAALANDFFIRDQVQINTRHEMGKRTRNQNNHRHHIKGYSGFLRGSQHIAGRTYQKTSEFALKKGIRELCCTSAIPNDVHTSFKYITDGVGKLNSPSRGYTGHLPGVRVENRYLGESIDEQFKRQFSDGQFENYLSMARRRKCNKPKNQRFWGKNFNVKHRYGK